MDIYWFLDVILRSKVLGNKTRYFNIDFYSNGLFLLFTYFKQAPSIQGEKINLGNQFHYKKYKQRDLNISKNLFSFSKIVFNMKLLVILFKAKKNSISQEIFLVYSIQVTGSTYSGIVFETIISQRNVHILEGHWKNSVCIGVKNFDNL